MKKTLLLLTFISLILPACNQQSTLYKKGHLAYVTARTGLIIRETPDTNSKKIASLNLNAQVSIIKYGKNAETIGDKNAPWAQILYQPEDSFDEPEYVKGWVFSGFLKKYNTNYSDLTAHTTLRYKKSILAYKELLILKDNDIILPTFSPDSKKMAFVSLTSDGKSHSSKLMITDLDKNYSSVIIDDAIIKKYKVYSSLITQIDWIDINTLKVHVSDGDVGGTDLIIDIAKKIIKKTKEITDTTDDIENYPKHLLLAEKKTLSNFPGISQGILRASFNVQSYSTSENGMIFQWAAWGYDDYVRYFDFIKKRSNVLFKFPNNADRLHPGFYSKEKSIFLIVQGNKFHIFQYQQGRTKLLYRNSYNEGPVGLKTIYQKNNKTVFYINQCPRYKAGNNPFFLHDGEDLHLFENINNLHSAQISDDGKKAAFVFWAGKERKIRIADINLL